MKIRILLIGSMGIFGVLVVNFLPAIIITGLFNPVGYWQQYTALATTLIWIKAISLNMLRAIMIFIDVFENDDEDLVKTAEFIRRLINRQKPHMECEIDG